MVNYLKSVYLVKNDRTTKTSQNGNFSKTKNIASKNMSQDKYIAVRKFLWNFWTSSMFKEILYPFDVAVCYILICDVFISMLLFAPYLPSFLSNRKHFS